MANPGAASSQLPRTDDWIVREIEDIKRQLRELGPSIAQSFNSTVAGIILPAAKTVVTSGFLLTTTSTVLAEIDIPVEPGYTRAIVSVYGILNGATGATSGDYIYAKTIINGVPSANETFFFLPTTYQIGTVPTMQATLLSGLVDGGTIVTQLAGHLNVGPGTGTAFSIAQLLTQVTFLK